METCPYTVNADAVPDDKWRAAAAKLNQHPAIIGRCREWADMVQKIRTAHTARDGRALQELRWWALLQPFREREIPIMNIDEMKLVTEVVDSGSTTARAVIAASWRTGFIQLAASAAALGEKYGLVATPEYGNTNASNGDIQRARIDRRDYDLLAHYMIDICAQAFQLSAFESSYTLAIGLIKAACECRYESIHTNARLSQYWLGELDRFTNALSIDFDRSKADRPPVEFVDIHDSSHTSAINMKSNWDRYMRDVLGGKELPKALPELSVTAETLRLQNPEDYKQFIAHFANDLYQTYKFIVRDVLFHEFQIRMENPDDKAISMRALAGFNDDSYTDFIHNLFYFRLGTWLPHGTEVDVDPKDPLCLAIGESATRALVPEIAKDSESANSDTQVHIETLLRYVKHYAAANIGVPKVGIVLSPQYRAAYELLRSIAAQLNGTAQPLIRLFGYIREHRAELYSDATNTSDVFTFIKIRASSAEETNRRFVIQVDSPPTSIMLTYEDQEEVLYPGARDWVRNYLGRVPYGDYLRIQKPPLPRPTVAPGSRYTYLFGRYDAIYGPSVDATKIVASTAMQHSVVARLNAGRDVFMFDYGQSGAGKTTLIIFDRITATEGVAAQICGAVDAAFTTLNVRIQEIGVVDGKPAAAIDLPVYQSHPFTRSGAHWGDANGISLSRYIVDTVEKNRITRGTTNNPTSSRTHIIVYIHLAGAKRATLIVGDFAGVENVFQCQDNSTLRRFAEVRTEHRNDGTGGELVYAPTIEAQYRKRTAQFTSGDKRIDTIWKPTARSVPSNLFALDYSALESMESVVRKEFNDKGYYDTLRVKLTQEVDLDTIINEAAKLRSLWGANGGRMSAALNFRGTGIGLVYVTPGATGVTAEMVAGRKDLPGFFAATQNVQRYLNPGGRVVTSINPTGNADTAERNYSDVKHFTRSAKVDAVLYAALLTLAQRGMEPICEERRNEGSYINESLAAFRQSIHKQLSARPHIQHAIRECGMLQCNPFFADCYGDSYVVENPRHDLIMENIVKEIGKERADTLTYCIVTVINISIDTNDPPTTPFIDDADIVYEYNRLRSTPLNTHSDVSDHTAHISAIIEETTKRIRDHRTIDGSVKDRFSTSETLLLHKLQNLAVNRDAVIKELRQYIDELEQLNASSLVGTLTFTDAVSKFGMNRMICRVDVDQPTVEQNNNFWFLGRGKALLRRVAKHMDVLKLPSLIRTGEKL